MTGALALLRNLRRLIRRPWRPAEKSNPTAAASSNAAATATQYSSFAEAYADCQLGYSDPGVAQVVLAKTLRAMQQPWPDLTWTQGAGLFMAVPYCALVTQSRALRVLDFGGSFGAHGMIVRSRMPEIPVRWAVVESETFAALARPVEDESLRVFATIEAACDWLGGVDLMHSSGALQYVPDPDATLTRLVALRAPVMMWQRMALSKGRRATVIQTSRLADNGIGPLPPSFTDRPVKYPNTYLALDEFLSGCAGYRLVARVPGTEPTADGLAVFGDAMLFARDKA